MVEEPPRFVFVMIGETNLDNLLYTKENMQKEYKLQPENIDDIIVILINYWFDNKRSM